MKTLLDNRRVICGWRLFNSFVILEAGCAKQFAGFKSPQSKDNARALALGRYDFCDDIEMPNYNAIVEILLCLGSMEKTHHESESRDRKKERR